MSVAKITDRLISATTNAKYESIIQTRSKIYNAEFTITNPNGNYIRTPLQISITARRANSAFLVMLDVQGYCSTSFGTGWNVAIGRSYNQNQNKSQSNNNWQDGPSGIAGPGDTLIAGLDLGQSYNGGNPEDSWMGMGHNTGISVSSWSKIRTVLDKPTVSVGTTLTYTAFLGGWTTAGSISMGWSSYNHSNKITVFEFAQ